jgi:hypothetical protein
MAFKKLPVVPRDRVHIGCLTCSSVQYPKISMHRRIWGEEDSVTKNGKEIYSSITCDGSEESFKKAPTLMKFENMARKTPNADWRYKRITGLHDEEYQRQGKNYWVMIHSGEGYA